MRSSRFDCRDVDRLLDLEDVSRRPDRAALARHLGDCERCRALAPELEWLYGKLESGAQPSQSRPSRRLVLALSGLAVLLIGLTLVLDREPPAIRGPVAPTTETDEPARLLPAHHSHFEAGVVRLLPDQELRSSSSSATLSPESGTVSEPAPMEWAR